ncbi:MAG: DUF3418 domain-containing protein, partial [Deltaproteobacteria bacterium]|nr:DUF3418 domain-containing protein [Deltaproteobacteria bacterium]
WRAARKKWEREGIREWDFGPIPESISLGPHQHAYPGLEAEDTGVNLRLFSTHEEALESHQEGVQSLFCLFLAKDLKYMKRNLRLSKGENEGAVYFGGADQVEKDLYDSLVRRLFCRDIRTPEAFEAHLEMVRPNLLTEAGDFRAKALEIVEAYCKTRSVLHNIETTNHAGRAVQTLCEEIRKDLDTILPKDFLHRYPGERLDHIPRYLKAMQIRAERGAHDPEKDRRKTARMAPFVRVFLKMRDGMSPHASPEKREAMEALYWMMEEYRVSLFAQELKTPLPVSAKRLEKRMRALERMV